MRQHLLILLITLGVALSAKSKVQSSLRQFDDEDFLNNDMAQTSIYNQARLLKNFNYKCGDSVECLKYLTLISEQVKNKLQFSFGGPVGEAGPFGEEGERGPAGLKGEKGEKGEKGPKGKPGQIVLGRKGEKGEKGPKGPKGEIGEMGEKGEKGERGEQGMSGEDGIDGFDGMEGERGEKGPKGEKGEKGPKGPTGVKGILGKQGLKGAIGMQGSPGVQGKPGHSGGKGGNGIRGKDVNITETYLKINEVVMQQFDEIVNKINFGNNYGFINLTLVSELKNEDQCLKEFGAYFLMCPDLQDCASQDCLNAVQILKCCLKTTKVGSKAKELQKISSEITKDTYKWIAMLYVPEWKSIRHNILVQTEKCWLRNIQSDFYCLVPDTDLLKIKVLQNHKRAQIKQASVMASNLQGVFDKINQEGANYKAQPGMDTPDDDEEEKERDKEGA